jgi:outer membrane beta-barrel protein
MKTTLLAVLALFSVGSALAATSPLESELNALSVPADKAMVSTTKDKLFSIQSRLYPLGGRHELSFSGGKNLNQDGHLNSNQWGGQYRYHVNDKWAFGLNYFRVNNELSSAGKKLVNDKGIIPDRDYVVSQTDVMAEYNLFYGKMRLDLDSVVYFDQYWGLGAGQVELGGGNSTAMVLDAGFAFWFGKMASARMGLKNDFYTEKNVNGSTSVHNMVGYVAFGILLGGNQ